MVSVKQAPRRYFVELLISVLLYLGSLHLRDSFAHGHPDPSLLKTFILLSPILPSALIAIAILRFYRRMDEMHRRHMLESVGIGALVCGLGSIALSFSHGAGLPRTDIAWAWPLMGMGWLLATAWRGLNSSIAESGVAATSYRAAGMAAFVLLPTLAYALAAPALGWPHRHASVVLFATLMIVIQAGWAIFRRDPK